MYRNEKIQPDRDDIRLNLRGRRPYIKSMLHRDSIPLSELDRETVNRAIDAGAVLQRMGIRVSLGVIDPKVSTERLRSNLVPGEVVLYRKDFRVDTATVDIPYCRETVRDGLNNGSPTQRIQNVMLRDIVPVGR